MPIKRPDMFLFIKYSYIRVVNKHELVPLHTVTVISSAKAGYIVPIIYLRTNLAKKKVNEIAPFCKENQVAKISLNFQKVPRDYCYPATYVHIE